MSRRVPESDHGFTRRAFLQLGGGAALAAGWWPRAIATGQASSAVSPPDGLTFPGDFLWGASTSAYQIEGAAREDGRGESIWDVFCRQPGAIANGQTGDVAADHYHRYAGDVGLMTTIGLGAYRFSVSWPRILPQGTGALNDKGLDFYKRLVDRLLEARITPFLMLYHWDFPQALQDRGGWLNRDAVSWFADYAAAVTRHLSDRVDVWLTMNEPRSFLGGGYVAGVHAPGLKLPLQDVLRAGHHLNLAHGRAVQAIRASAGRPVQVSCAPDCSPALPVSGSDADVAAARSTTFAVPRDRLTERAWWRNNAWWFDPIFTGAYPADGLASAGADAPDIRDGDMDLIRQPLDFLGVNIYGGARVRAGSDGRAETVPFPADWPRADNGWEVAPDALYWGPKWLHERYGLPIYVLENGLSLHDAVSVDGRVHDQRRIDFMTSYLRALSRVIREGTPVQGYFHWSLLDNFEWHTGFRERFGLVHVDFDTLQRTPKDSARWYAALIAASRGGR
jgi:beta-glucosidase